ncbi:hypothetical protein SAMN02746041_03291 [Desulfacinum hydrothermale DSM 13146]|uniref:Uncharacterized protein n=1 Tax=Desulfacinum hydrothermale DSM 13146 TaxID=1121390 RepID=A0A1W1XXC4_9BACT|nr:hypothetical protein [Desulfacinum hydrothermale]SMC28467.1 hypothetical protein SAMN02746041_03257 [Desulfacinum hydrothermale DSM 13146]SMC28630.1 hypothetical protein SAMN02746041_03291 [Desulfacinum hydrothermale DSM 13146]
MAKINGCMVCLDCDEVFSGAQSCPKCGSSAYWPLGRWVRSAERGWYGRRDDAWMSGDTGDTPLEYRWEMAG